MGGGIDMPVYIFYSSTKSKDEDDLQTCLLSFYLAAGVDESRHTIVKETANLHLKHT